MVIGKTTSRVDRRRRVLNEDRREHSAPSTIPIAGGHRADARPPRRYTDAVCPDQQLRVGQLIPTRPWTVSVWLLAALTVVVGQFAATATYFATRLDLSTIDYRPLRMDFSPSLFSAFCSASLLLSAAYSGLIVSLRRHRLDDYRGTYRIWYYLTAANLAASLLLASGAHRILASAWDAGTVWLGMANSHAPSLVAYFSLLALAIRVGFEIKSSRGAITMLLITGATGTVAWLSPLVLPVSINAEVRELLTGTCGIACHLGGLLTLVLYGRYVTLDAQGILAAPFETNGDEPHKSRPPQRRLPFLPRWPWPRQRTRPAVASAADESPSISMSGKAKLQQREPAADPPMLATDNPGTFQAAASGSEPAAKKASRSVSSPTHASTSETDNPESPSGGQKPEVLDGDDDEDEGMSLSRTERKRQRKEKRKQRRAA